MSDHRWSGWPGAWCLDCGAQDEREVCVATCDWVCGAYALAEHTHGPGASFAPPPCPVHVNAPCPAPRARAVEPPAGSR